MAKEAKETPIGGAFPIAYEVINVEPWTFLDARGNPVAGYKVTFTYEGGFVDWIDIPEKTYNAANVKAAIQNKISKHIEVLTLGMG